LFKEERVTVLNYRTAGNAKGPALLLVHALGTDLRFWEGCIDIWQSKYFCIAPDLRAAGKSPRPDKPVTIPEHAADLEELRKSLGVTPVVSIGCAIGAMIAACYAARYPDSTRALIMANPGMKSSDAAKDMLRKRAVALRTTGFSTIMPEAADKAFHNLPQDARYKLHSERFLAQDPQTYALSVEGFIDADITGDLARLKCPLLLVPGEYDIMMPSDSSANIKEIVPRAEIQMVPGVAHFMPFQAPDKFAKVVSDYLERTL
jgi:3-oxoadipate enol-lactonase